MTLSSLTSFSFIVGISFMLSIADAWVNVGSPAIAISHPRGRVETALYATKTTTAKESVTELKKVLEREYVSFFNPMRTEYYAKDVTFDDPLTSLAGVDAYKANVDMLSGRTLLGSILFEDGGINLHSVTGGEIYDDGTIQDIITRWTLRFTMKVWPWKPTARFSGISVYKVKPVGDGVQIVGQLDYWDSINLKEGGVYEKVEKGEALSDFLNQLKPGGFQASLAAPELPYSLLRRGKDYEVRRYPAYSAVKLKYERRDEGFGTLGAFTSGTETPQGPAIMEVEGTGDKFMQWPLTYATPGSDTAPEPTLAFGS
ncbi:SOUL heme-binding protein [Fragilaria crotonensis]|nr:SOUL heme-binding protein [Fragilaria crotonensis]